MVLNDTNKLSYIFKQFMVNIIFLRLTVKRMTGCQVKKVIQTGLQTNFCKQKKQWDWSISKSSKLLWLFWNLIEKNRTKFAKIKTLVLLYTF